MAPTHLAVLVTWSFCTSHGAGDLFFDTLSLLQISSPLAVTPIPALPTPMQAEATATAPQKWAAANSLQNSRMMDTWQLTAGRCPRPAVGVLFAGYAGIAFRARLCGAAVGS